MSLKWIDENKKVLLALLAGGVLFFAGLAGLSYWRDLKEQKAQEALYLAEKNQTDLQQVVLEHPKTKAAFLALIDLAQKSLQENKMESCLDFYDQLYQQAGDEPFFRVTALHGKADCHRAQKEGAKACSFYEQAAKEPGHADPMASRFEAARCLGEPALKTLLDEKNLNEEWKNKIESELIWLALREKQ